MKLHVYSSIFSILALALPTLKYEVLHVNIYHVSFLVATPNKNGDEGLQGSSSKSGISKAVGRNGEDNERYSEESDGEYDKRSDGEDDNRNDGEDDNRNDGENDKGGRGDHKDEDKDEDEDEEKCTSLDSGNFSLISDCTVGSQDDPGDDDDNVFRNKLLSMESLSEVRIFCMYMFGNLNIWEKRKEEKSSTLKETYKILFRTEGHLESSGLNTEVQSGDGNNGDENKVGSGGMNKLYMKHQGILDKISRLEQRLEYIQSKIDETLSKVLICEEVILLLEEKELRRREASVEALSLLESILADMTPEQRENMEINRERTRKKFFKEL
ncbi:hypothetical protein cand_003860 [Cryptosporidium andersoni]|uniref:Uncharacterized protein n=1 Tax=Cryptosporidium andersoni TaxID=117008 RepID=A0A1J4MMF8_9CRYT|nr:hypothetical protein cand_003860 [Cryptosporidium andersoni]